MAARAVSGFMPAPKGTNAQDGELHAAADKQASLQVAHNQTGNHTGEDG